MQISKINLNFVSIAYAKALIKGNILLKIINMTKSICNTFRTMNIKKNTLGKKLETKVK